MKIQAARFIRKLIIPLLLCSLVTAGRGQTNDTVVGVEAEAAGLSLASDLPSTGTFWLVTAPNGSGNGVTVPFPCLPPDISGDNTYVLPNGSFLIDATGDESGASPAQLAAQANAVSNLIMQTTAVMSRTMGLRAMDDSGPPVPGGGGGGTNDYSDTNLFSTYSFDTNLLWLSISNVSGGMAYLNANNATDEVYAIYGTTNLLTPFTNWNVITELWPTNGTTNVLPFMVAADNNVNLFWRAEDWTGVYANGLPLWWMWEYFGSFDETAAMLDSSGNNTLGYDFTNDYDPNVISFTLSFTNQFINAYAAPVQLAVTTGTPSYLAVLVDDTNLADASWTAYASSNITVNLGVAEGWHQVSIGLRGLPSNAYQTWQSTRLKLDLTPPVLVITNPVADTVTQPVIQLQGYSSENLASLTYDVSNASGLLTNQTAMILNQFYDTNTLEFTTNYFQCFDVSLTTNGVNVITLHAADMAGNVTTTNFSYNYIAPTNPPTVQLYWPQVGTQISGSSFTWRGWISDPTAQVAAQTVDTNGITNSVSGQVGRNGSFWISGLPLSGGTNNFSLVATDAAGNTSATNVSVIQSALVLTITSAGLGQAVIGTISDTNFNDYTIWVNGTKATNNGDGTWIAQDPHLTLDTPNVQVRAIPNSDNGGNGGGQ